MFETDPKKSKYPWPVFWLEILNGKRVRRDMILGRIILCNDSDSLMMDKIYAKRAGKRLDYFRDRIPGGMNSNYQWS